MEHYVVIYHLSQTSAHEHMLDVHSHHRSNPIKQTSPVLASLCTTTNRYQDSGATRVEFSPAAMLPEVLGIAAVSVLTGVEVEVREKSRQGPTDRKENKQLSSKKRGKGKHHKREWSLERQGPLQGARGSGCFGQAT